MLQLLANGKLEKLKSQRRSSGQKPEKSSLQFQLSMLQVGWTVTNGICVWISCVIHSPWLRN